MHVTHAVCDAEEWFHYLQVSYERFTCILPLSSRPGMTISSFAMTLRGEGGGGPGLNVT